MDFASGAPVVQGRTNKKKPSKKQGLQKKKGGKRALRKIALRKKKRAVKNKKKQGDRPFFLIHKIGALDWEYPSWGALLNIKPESEQHVKLLFTSAHNGLLTK